MKNILPSLSWNIYGNIYKQRDRETSLANNLILSLARFVTPNFRHLTLTSSNGFKS